MPQFLVVRSIITQVLLTLTVTCSMLSSMTFAADTFDKPKKQLDIKLKKFSDSKTILLPGYFLHLLTEGQHKRSNWGARAKVNYYVTNLSPEIGQSLATELHADLVEKLRASGWTVLTSADTAELDWESIGEQSPLKETGLPGLKVNQGFGDQVYITSGPEGVPLLKRPKLGFPGPVDPNKLLKISKSLDANVMHPYLRFDAPVGSSKKQRGYSKVYAEAKVSPVLDLVAADATSLSATGKFSWFSLKKPIRLSEQIGELTEVASESSSGVSLFTYDTFRSVSEGDYSFSLDLDAFQAAILTAGKDFNSALVDALQPVAPKP